MLDLCPICGFPLYNGEDSKQHIEYPEDKRAAFDAGELTLEQLNEFAIIYYNRPRLCTNKGNNDTLTGIEGSVPINPPCPNYCGTDRSNPVKVVEWLKIIDN